MIKPQDFQILSNRHLWNKRYRKTAVLSKAWEESVLWLGCWRLWPYNSAVTQWWEFSDDDNDISRKKENLPIPSLNRTDTFSDFVRAEIRCGILCSFERHRKGVYIVRFQDAFLQRPSITGIHDKKTMQITWMKNEYNRKWNCHERGYNYHTNFQTKNAAPAERVFCACSLFKPNSFSFTSGAHFTKFSWELWGDVSVLSLLKINGWEPYYLRLFNHPDSSRKPW